MPDRQPDRVADVHATTVRFTDEQWAIIRREAERQGVSAAELVREGAIAWLAYQDGRREAAALEQRVARIEQHLGLTAP